MIRLGRAGAIVVAVGLCLVLSACQAKVRVGIDVRDDGSGSVVVTAQLDRDAASAVPDLAQQLRTSDLAQAGWRIEGPTPAARGAVVVSATKPFRTLAEARAVVAEVSGPTGPLPDLSIGQHRSLFTTRTDLRGTVDLTCGLKCFADPQLQQALGGAPDLGLDPAKLQADAGIIVNRYLQFEVAVRLPGSVQASNAPTQAGNGVTWDANVGTKAVLLATARSWNTAHLALAVALALVLLAALVLLLLRIRGSRRGRSP